VVSFGATTFTLDSTSALGVDAPITGAAHALHYGVTNVTIAAGTTTLSSGQYTKPIVVLSSSALAGDASVLFPSEVGAIWTVVASGVNLNGHLLKIGVGSGGPTNAPTSSTSFLVICVAANVYNFLPSS
jgi:hypothetical protein